MKNIKWFFVILLTITLLLSNGEATNGMLLENSKAGRIYDACLWQDGLVVLGTTGVWLYKPETGELTSFLNFAELPTGTISGPGYPDYIFSVHREIYMFSSRAREFYRIKDQTVEICMDDVAGIFTFDDQGEERHKKIINIVAADDGVYLLLSYMTFTDGNIYELIYLDIPSGEVTSFGKQEIDMLYSWSKGQLLAGRITDNGEGRELYLLDKDNNTFYELNNSIYNVESAGFVWDGEKICYMQNDGQVSIEMNGEQTIVAYVPYEALRSSARAFMWKDLYVYLQDYVLNTRSINTNPENLITIKILGGVDESIVRGYIADNPGVNIVSDYREDSFLGLQEALVSNDSSVDLFLVESDTIYQDVIKKGYAARLDESESLVHRISSFYQWAKDILMPDGTLYAIPVSFNSEYWTINRSMWRALELGEYPQCYDDVFTTMEIWNEKYADQYSEYSLFESMDEIQGMLRLIIRQYLLIHEDWQDPVDFDTPEFRKAVQDTLNHSDIFEFDGETLPLIMNYPQYLGLGYNDSDIVEAFLPPTLTKESDKVVRGVMGMLMLNPSSAKSEEAIHFLEYYIEHLDMRTMYMLDAGRTEPLRPDNYEEDASNLSAKEELLIKRIADTEDEEVRRNLVEELNKVQESINDLESQWIFSSEDIAIYRKIAEKTVIPTRTIYPERDSVYSEMYDNAIEQFVENRISVDEFIYILNQKSMMAFMESI